MSKEIFVAFATQKGGIGMVNDKDVSGVLSMLPKDARYYFTQASVKRALPYQQMKALAETFNFKYIRQITEEINACFFFQFVYRNHIFFQFVRRRIFGYCIYDHRKGK